MRYRDVLFSSWQNDSILHMLSGMPAHLCYQLVNVGRDYLQEKFLRYLCDGPLFRDPKTHKPRKLLLIFVDRWYIPSIHSPSYPCGYVDADNALVCQHCLGSWSILSTSTPSCSPYILFLRLRSSHPSTPSSLSPLNPHLPYQGSPHRFYL